MDGAEATAAKSPDPVGGDGDDGHGDDPGPAQQPVDRRAFLADEIGRAQPERDHRENQMYPDGRHGTEPGKGEIWRQTTPVAAESRGNITTLPPAGEVPRRGDGGATGH